MNTIDKKNFEEGKKAKFDIKLSFGSQNIQFANENSRDLDNIRLCATSVLALNRQKWSIFNSDDNKLITKVLPKDSIDFKLSNQHKLKLEDLNYQLSYSFV